MTTNSLYFAPFLSFWQGGLSLLVFPALVTKEQIHCEDQGTQNNLNIIFSWK